MDADCSGHVRDHRGGGDAQSPCEAMMSGVQTAEAGGGRQNQGKLNALVAFKLREGKVVRPDGESQDVRVATVEWWPAGQRLA